MPILPLKISLNPLINLIKNVIKYLRGKIDFLCETRKPVHEEIQIANDNYYVSCIPVPDNYYFNVYAVKITDYVQKSSSKRRRVEEFIK